MNDQVQELQDQVRELTTLVHAFGWSALVLLVILVGLGVWGRSYLQKKGTNLADKEDIAELTRIAKKADNLATKEDIREIAELEERGRTDERLRLAVMEKRFQAHQEAWTLWNRLITADSTTEGAVIEAAMNCQTWWTTNCLYLDEEPRNAFLRAFKAMFTETQIKASMKGRARKPGDHEPIEDCWVTAVAAGAIITSGAELRPIRGVDTREQSPTP